MLCQRVVQIPIAVESRKKLLLPLPMLCKRNSQSAGFMQSISKYFSYRAAGQHARIRHQYEAVATISDRHTLSGIETHHDCVSDMWNRLLCMSMMIQDSILPHQFIIRLRVLLPQDDQSPSALLELRFRAEEQRVALSVCRTP
jgi:hypothetical protein